MSSRPWKLGLAAVAAVVVGYLACAPVEAEPVAWDPPPAEAWASEPIAVMRLLEGEGVGPEDIAVDAQGRVYTGYEDGRILRAEPDGSDARWFATLPQGRPLGMEFDAKGHLIVADGQAGLVTVDPEGVVTVLVDEVDGEPLVFADDLDIAPDGTIWFSEASRRWSVHDSTLDAIEGAPTGRLLAYDPGSGEATVHLRELRYANGVAVTPSGDAVLVAETFGYRVRRLWIEGEQAGRDDMFVEAMPGMPDNVQIDDEGRVWVALVKERSGLLDGLGPYPRVRTVLFRIPRAALPVPPPVVWFAVFDADGQRLGTYRSEDGFGDVTSVNPVGASVWLGSLTMSALGKAPRPQL
ncbi:MAG: SMP-30/gluconolactonase/LRE family protein [Nannocystaceae bacterium]|nr:SMP-30/gluconolactonase/LRE family protein [bacterium]